MTEGVADDIAEIFNTPLSGAFNWDYTVQDNRIKKLYELGKELNWNVELDIDWSRPFEPLTEPQPIFWDDYAPYQKLSDNKKVDFLKAYEMLSPNQFKLLSKMAKENNLKLTGHVPLSMDVITASNLGLNSMEHLRNIELSMSENFDSYLSDRLLALENKGNLSGSKLRSSLHLSQRIKAVSTIDASKQEAVLNVLAENDTWQIPTLELYQTFANKKYKEKTFQSHFSMIPDSIRSKWLKEINSTSTEIDQDILKYTQWSSEMVNKMHKKNIPFMAGTDTPIGYLIPGLSLHEELIQLNNSGFSNLETLFLRHAENSIFSPKTPKIICRMARVTSSTRLFRAPLV